MKQLFTPFLRLLLVSFLFFSVHAGLRGQSFMPADWQQGIYFIGNLFQSPPSGNASAHHVSDTTMCGNTYAKVCRRGTWPGSGASCTVTEYYRLAGTRVFGRPSCAAPEQVLYDWGLVVGDTITIDHGICYTGRFAVDTVANMTLLDGSVRKYFVLHGQNPWNTGDTIRWIEDIGDMRGGFMPNCDFEGGHSNLVCHKESGIKRYAHPQNSALWDCDTLLAAWAVAVAEPKAMAVTLRPQPCHTELHISTTDPGLQHVVLYDLSGRILRTADFIGSCVLDTEALPAGMYLYAMESADGAIARGRILRQ